MFRRTGIVVMSDGMAIDAWKPGFAGAGLAIFFLTAAFIKASDSIKHSEMTAFFTILSFSDGNRF